MSARHRAVGEYCVATLLILGAAQNHRQLRRLRDPGAWAVAYGPWPKTTPSMIAGLVEAKAQLSITPDPGDSAALAGTRCMAPLCGHGPQQQIGAHDPRGAYLYNVVDLDD